MPSQQLRSARLKRRASSPLSPGQARVLLAVTGGSKHADDFTSVNARHDGLAGALARSQRRHRGPAPLRPPGASAGRAPAGAGRGAGPPRGRGAADKDYRGDVRVLGEHREESDPAGARGAERGDGRPELIAIVHGHYERSSPRAEGVQQASAGGDGRFGQAAADDRIDEASGEHMTEQPLLGRALRAEAQRAQL